MLLALERSFFNMTFRGMSFRFGWHKTEVTQHLVSPRLKRGLAHAIMTDLPTDDGSKEPLSNYMYIGSLYFICVGVLYLWGYWSPFGVNILEHLALADVLKITAYPIASAVFLSGIGAALGEAFVRGAKVSPGGGRGSSFERFLRRFFTPLILLYAVSTVALLLYGPIEKWRILPVFLGAPLYFAANQARVLHRLIPHEGPRSVVLYVLATLPPFAFGHGLLAANKIQTGSSFTYLVSELPHHPARTEPTDALRYVGTAGERMFFFDPLRIAVVLAKVGEAPPIVVKQFEPPMRQSQAVSRFDPGPSSALGSSLDEATSSAKTGPSDEHGAPPTVPSDPER